MYIFDREGQYINKQILLDLSIFKTVMENNLYKGGSADNGIETWNVEKEKILNVVKDYNSKIDLNKLSRSGAKNENINNARTSYKLKKQSTNVFFNKRYQDYGVNKNMIFLRKLFSANDMNTKFNLSNYFVFNYLIWIISMFNFKPVIINNKIKLINSNKIHSISGSSTDTDKNDLFMEDILNDYLCQIELNKSLNNNVKKHKSKLTLIKYLIPERNRYIYNNKVSVNNIGIINIVLFKLLSIILAKSTYKYTKDNVVIKNNMVNSSLKNFIMMYISKYNIIFKNTFNKELNITDSLNKWIFIKRKLSSFIPYLKVLLNKVYEKNIELNIVNLKYIQLNSSLLVNATSIKLRKRKLDC